MDFSSIFWFNLMIFQNWGGELKMQIKTFKNSTNHLVKNKRKANGFIYFEPIFSSWAQILLEIPIYDTQSVTKKPVNQL